MMAWIWFVEIKTLNYHGRYDLLDRSPSEIEMHRIRYYRDTAKIPILRNKINS